jgi:N-acetylmuramic acid 6-phosphate etherase
MSTEAVDPRYSQIDQWPTQQAVSVMLDGQREAVESLASQIGAISAAAEAAAIRLGMTGRITYAGAGTSGRIGVQDGVELTPTYGWPESRLAFFLAGGMDAVMRAVEGAEDNGPDARAQVIAANIGPSDVLIGVAASGRTPFTIAAIEEARARGALTIGVASNAGAPLLGAAEHAILLDTGSEAIAGSTRMKAGTAQKAALNLLSTAIMLRQGLVFRGLMVNMRISNVKLRHRAGLMVSDVAGVDEAKAQAALDQTNGDIRRAILVALGLSLAEAEARLANSHGHFQTVLASLVD